MAHYFFVAARLKPGITLAQANAQLKLAADQFRRTYADALGPPGGEPRPASLPWIPAVHHAGRRERGRAAIGLYSPGKEVTRSNLAHLR